MPESSYPAVHVRFKIMDTNKQAKIVNAGIVGAIAAVLLVVLLTIAGDLYAPLKKLLKDVHHHHWIGKGVWSAILFMVMALGYGVFSKAPQDEKTPRLLKTLSWVTALGTVVLILFFIYEFSRH